MSVKASWDKVGRDFKTVADDIKDKKLEGGHVAQLGEDIGRSVVRSVKAGLVAADKWAEKDNPDGADDTSAHPDK